MTDPTDMEALAAQEHESWAKWTKWMLSQIEAEILDVTDEPGKPRSEIASAVITGLNTLPCVQRWKRQMETPYANLFEKEKESDREVVREKLPLYRLDALRDLIETALASAHEEGMEFVAETEGCSWSGASLEQKKIEAEEARSALYRALGLDPNE